MMKLLIAVLSSTLIACSVTTATPVNPSATANLGSSSTAIYTATATTYPSTSTFTGLDVNSVDCGDYSTETKEAIKGYAEAKYDVELMGEKFSSLLAEITNQKTILIFLRGKVRSISKTKAGDGSPDYTETLSLIQDGNAALSDFENQQEICVDQHSVLYEKMRLTEQKLSGIFFDIFDFDFGRVDRCIKRLLASQIFMGCFNQFYPGIPVHQQALSVSPLGEHKCDYHTLCDA
ncbi:hypothetical protein QVD99_004853 [Batrachochytrium dendrobatidis]|nr:hypothetical protein QVD99_004853 [Batrachochytrium dendrobatidis]